jgi:hypothetical protein
MRRLRHAQIVQSLRGVEHIDLANEAATSIVAFAHDNIVDVEQHGAIELRLDNRNETVEFASRRLQLSIESCETLGFSGCQDAWIVVLEAPLSISAMLTFEMEKDLASDRY